MTDRTPGAVPLRASVVDALAAPLEGAEESALLTRLELALATLPPAERTAVVAAYGFAGGPVGAAVELGLEVEDADAVARNGLQLLRGALDDLDAHGHPSEA